MRARSKEVKGKSHQIKGETNDKLQNVMDDPTLEGKNENEVGRVQPKPDNAREK
jgi:uncharacterized protein YjbJ (UPF0337 family)